MKKKKTIKRLRRMIKCMAKENSRIRRTLMKIAYYDLNGYDPLAICAVRQWAKESLDE